MARCHVTIATRQVWKFETDGTTLRCNDSFKTWTRELPWAQGPCA